MHHVEAATASRRSGGRVVAQPLLALRDADVMTVATAVAMGGATVALMATR
jgi:hypothetical protein